MAPVTLPAAEHRRADRGGPRGRRSSPGRDEVVDAAALIVLTMIGIAGFRPAYGGHGYLAAGAAGVVLGLLLSHVGQRARLPLRRRRGRQRAGVPALRRRRQPDRHGEPAGAPHGRERRGLRVDSSC